jgi:hypothetical protein
MSRTTHYAALICIVFGLAFLLGPASAQARRPSTVASKTYSSGKFLGKLSIDVADDLVKPADCDKSDVVLTSRTSGDTTTTARTTTPVHVSKPLHVSLPHATKQLPKIASTQFGQ